MGAWPEGDGSQGLGVAGGLVAVGRQPCPVSSWAVPHSSAPVALRTGAEQDPCLCEPHRPPVPCGSTPLSLLACPREPRVHG